MNDTNTEIKKLFYQALEDHKKSQFKNAEDLYNKILEIDRNHIDATYLLGMVFLQKKNLPKAIIYFDKVIKINPNHINALHNLGSALVEMKDTEKAKKLLLRVIEIYPQHADAHYNLGNIYKYYKDLKKAKLYFEKTIQIQPNNTKAHNNLGNVFKELGCYNKAIIFYKKAIEIEHDHFNAYHNLANTYKQQGKFKIAENYYLKSLKYRPHNLETKSLLIELNGKYLKANLEDKLKDILKNKKTSEKNLAYANFILSKIESKKSNLEKEFSFLLKGHEHYFLSKKKEFEMGLTYWFKELPKICKIINTKKINLTKDRYSNIRPIFIVGIPRCGSTLIEKIIASGKTEIPIGEETGIIGFLINKKFITNEPLNLNNIRKKIIQNYEERGFLNKKNNFIFTDKSLDNFFYIGLISKIFPKAKIINCQRNIVATIVSIIKNDLGDISWAHNLESIFRYIDIYHKNIKVFKKNYPNLLYDLQLENLIKNPERESKKLMRFCDLIWDKKCLEYYKRRDLISKTASNIQIRNGIYKDLNNRHNSYKKFLDKYGNNYSWYK